MTRGRKGGRPGKLTDELEAELCRVVRAGATMRAACDRAGVSEDTVAEWRQRGEGRHPTRRRTARLARFARAMRAALAEAEIGLVATIRTSAKESWQAAAWLLERRYPADYGRRDRLEATVDNGPKTAALEAEIEALARKLAEAEAEAEAEAGIGE